MASNKGVGDMGSSLVCYAVQVQDHWLVLNSAGWLVVIV
jgi:hypothetical protein